MEGKAEGSEGWGGARTSPHGAQKLGPWPGGLMGSRAYPEVFGGGILGHQHTSVPVAQGGHDEEADSLVGPLLQHCGCEALVRPLQPWGQAGMEVTLGEQHAGALGRGGRQRGPLLAWPSRP